jgi:NitT/TauT family transport system substrate-binding protein
VLKRYIQNPVNSSENAIGGHMKNLNTIFLLAILCMALLGGCSKTTEKTTSEGTLSDNTQGEEQAEEKSQTPSVTEVPQVKKTTIKVAALKGPTSMGMIQVMEASANDEAGNAYEFTIAGTPDEITAGIIKGDYDAAAIPCNLAAVLYNKTQGQIVTAGINTLGVLYIVETGDTIHSIEDLKGKTIYTTGKGTTPEYTLNYLLSSYGLESDKDVTVEYKAEAAEVAALLSEKEDVVAMLPQPFVTTAMLNNDKLRIALDITEEWESISTNGSSVVTGVLVFKKDFLENNKEAVNIFLSEYEASAEYVNTNTEEAAKLIEKFDIIKAAVAKKAIPYCNITFLQDEDMQVKIQGYLETLYGQNPETVGGQLPAEDFYYKR